MASITKRGEAYLVRWKEIVVIDHGKGDTTREWQSRGRSCEDMATAKELRRDVENRAALGERWTPAAEEARVTMERIAEQYIDEKLLTWRGKTGYVASNHLDVFMRWLHKREGKEQVFADVLSKALLIEYAAFLMMPGTARGHRTRSRNTVNAMVKRVQDLWSWAGNEDEFAEKVPRPRTVAMREEAKNPVSAPTWAEMDACIATMGDTALARLCTVLRYTGLRVQQAMGLVWTDIDLHLGVLTLRGELGKTANERMGRIIPISPFLVEELKRWKAANTVWKPGWQRRGTWVRGKEPWVVPSHRRPGQTAHSVRDANQELMHLPWSAAGVPQAVWHRHVYHCFRSGFTSNLKKDGGDWEAVEHLIGHMVQGSRHHYLDPDYMPLRAAANLVPEIGSRTDGVHRMRISAEEAAEVPTEGTFGRVYTNPRKSWAKYARDAGARQEGVDEEGWDLSSVEMDGEQLGASMRWDAEAAMGWAEYLLKTRLGLKISLVDASKLAGGQMGRHEGTPPLRPPRMALVRGVAEAYERDVREVVLAAGYVCGNAAPITRVADAGRPAWSAEAARGFGEYLSGLRREARMTLKQVATAVGGSVGGVWRIEKEPPRWAPRVEVVAGFAAVFGVEVAEMMRAAGYVERPRLERVPQPTDVRFADRKTGTRERVREAHAAGMRTAEIAAATGYSLTTIQEHLRELGLNPRHLALVRDERAAG